MKMSKLRTIVVYPVLESEMVSIAAAPPCVGMLAGFGTFLCAYPWWTVNKALHAMYVPGCAMLVCAAVLQFGVLRTLKRIRDSSIKQEL